MLGIKIIVYRFGGKVELALAAYSQVIGKVDTISGEDQDWCTRQRNLVAGDLAYFWCDLPFSAFWQAWVTNCTIHVVINAQLEFRPDLSLRLTEDH